MSGYYVLRINWEKQRLLVEVLDVADRSHPRLPGRSSTTLGSSNLAHGGRIHVATEDDLANDDRITLQVKQ